ncbi:MAG TPA: TlpA disulfide reductase family protein [Pyrinomonadaceae bacterium]
MLLLSICCASLYAAAQQHRTPTPPAERKEVGFRLKALDGKTYDTAATNGEVWVVSFGATWCTPCTWELVAIEELKEEYAGKPVRFLWISIEDEKRASNHILKHYAKERRLTIPVLRDGDGSVLAQFTTTTRIPVVAFFGPDGKFDAPAHRGMSPDIADYKQLVRRRVDALLKAAKGTTAAAGGAATAN